MLDSIAHYLVDTGKVVKAMRAQGAEAPQQEPDEREY
jgi:hypothetical protein